LNKRLRGIKSAATISIAALNEWIMLPQKGWCGRELDAKSWSAHHPWNFC